MTVLDLDSMVNGTDPRDVVSARAREAGHPGVVWQRDPSMRVDFERSVEAIQSSAEYCLDARQQPAVASEPHVLVAIPAYNECETIADVVTEARPHADEVLVIDDGSEDDTSECARAAGATVIEHGRNQGYGAALKTAFREADRCRADHLVVLDGDGQHDPNDIPTLVRTQQEEDAEIVVGSRFDPATGNDIPLYRQVGLAVVNVLTNLSIGLVQPASRIRDTQCGFRAYDRRAIQSLAADSSIVGNMGASTDILHHASINGYDVAEVPTTVDYDVTETSTHNPVVHGITLIMNLLRTIEHERPILTVGVPGFASTTAGLGLGYWTVVNYVTSGTFPIGLAIAASFFGLVGVLACFAAIILHSLKQYLEK